MKLKGSWVYEVTPLAKQVVGAVVALSVLLLLGKVRKTAQRHFFLSCDTSPTRAMAEPIKTKMKLTHVLRGNPKFAATSTSNHIFAISNTPITQIETDSYRLRQLSDRPGQRKGSLMQALPAQPVVVRLLPSAQRSPEAPHEDQLPTWQTRLESILVTPQQNADCVMPPVICNTGGSKYIVRDSRHRV